MRVSSRSVLRALWVSVGLVIVLSSSGCGGSGSSGSSSQSGQTASPADRFLSGYVTGDGRVLRRDQGGDVVSEGQAYGMLIAQSAGRDDVAATIWSWTKAHLQTSDGLLAFHADADGKVLDHQAASDADTLTAYALLRARGAHAASLHADGRRLANAVLDHETMRDARGRPVLTAGPWAVDSGVVDPSYWMPTVFADLAHLTGDDRWHALAGTSVDLVEAMTDGGQSLPPDWARIEGDHVVPTGQGGGGGTPQYGSDAQRVPLWFAADCDSRTRHLAGAWWGILQQDDRSAALVLDLNGQTIDGSPSAVALLASAGAAEAAGDTSGAAQLRRGAEQTDQSRSTYYGAAWLALADTLARAGC